MPPSLLRLLTVALLGALVSCATSPRVQPGQTLYLDDYLNQTGPYPAAPSTARRVDTESFWNGDGLSGAPSIVIDLSDQKAYFYKGKTLAGVSILSTGDEAHPTPTGSFRITQKSQWHKSNLYGQYLDSAGNVIVEEVDVTKDKSPPGAHFEGARMHYFMRFNGGIGMHEGYLPGYPASHGCVRMPGHMARIFFNNVSNGTPVTVRH